MKNHAFNQTPPLEINFFHVYKAGFLYHIFVPFLYGFISGTHGSYNSIWNKETEIKYCMFMHKMSLRYSWVLQVLTPRMSQMFNGKII